MEIYIVFEGTTEGTKYRKPFRTKAGAHKWIHERIKPFSIRCETDRDNYAKYVWSGGLSDGVMVFEIQMIVLED